jgi:hypothetical protein
MICSGPWVIAHESFVLERAAENFPLFVCVSAVGLEKGFIFIDVIAHCSQRALDAQMSIDSAVHVKGVQS